ncbi:TRAP transporter small permease [Thalassospira alkalitolerans]|uniref:TRAP transporter small permease n=1 Tax=Thalassospira alkalitolerans TaxID=1293890 RepID=UPI003AA96ED2
MTQRAEKSDGSRLYAAAHQLDRFMNRLTDILAFIGMAALIGAIGIVVVDIIWRRIGGQSLVGAVDLTQFCVMAAASWAIPYAFSAHAHVTVDLIGKNHFRAVFRIIDTLIPALCAGLMAFLLYLSWGRAMEQWNYGDVSQNLAIPMILFWGFLLSGMAISMLVCLVHFLKLLLTNENI